MLRVPRISELAYKCKICGFLNIKQKSIPQNPDRWGIARGVTQLGHYSEGTPTPIQYDEEIYSATTISFTAASGSELAKINDSEHLLGSKGFGPGNTIVIASGSGTNDGAYTLAELGGVAEGSLSLKSGEDLTTEDAATAGTVTLSVRWYKPNITTGCPFCGTLNSR